MVDETLFFCIKIILLKLHNFFIFFVSINFYIALEAIIDKSIINEGKTIKKDINNVDKKIIILDLKFKDT